MRSNKLRKHQTKIMRKHTHTHKNTYTLKHTIPKTTKTKRKSSRQPEENETPYQQRKKDMNYSRLLIRNHASKKTTE